MFQHDDLQIGSVAVWFHQWLQTITEIKSVADTQMPNFICTILTVGWFASFGFRVYLLQLMGKKECRIQRIQCIIREVINMMGQTLTRKKFTLSMLREFSPTHCIVCFAWSTIKFTSLLTHCIVCFAWSKIKFMPVWASKKALGQYLCTGCWACKFRHCII